MILQKLWQDKLGSSTAVESVFVYCEGISCAQGFPLLQNRVWLRLCFKGFWRNWQSSRSIKRRIKTTWYWPNAFLVTVAHPHKHGQICWRGFVSYITTEFNSSQASVFAHLGYIYAYTTGGYTEFTTSTHPNRKEERRRNCTGSSPKMTWYTVSSPFPCTLLSASVNSTHCRPQDHGHARIQRETAEKYTTKTVTGKRSMTLKYDKRR